MRRGRSVCWPRCSCRRPGAALDREWVGVPVPQLGKLRCSASGDCSDLRRNLNRVRAAAYLFPALPRGSPRDLARIWHVRPVPRQHLAYCASPTRTPLRCGPWGRLIPHAFGDQPRLPVVLLAVASDDSSTPTASRASPRISPLTATRPATGRRRGGIAGRRRSQRKTASTTRKPPPIRARSAACWWQLLHRSRKRTACPRNDHRPAYGSGGPLAAG